MVRPAGSGERSPQPLYFTEQGVASVTERVRHLRRQLRSLAAAIRDEASPADEQEGSSGFTAIHQDRVALEAQIAELEAMLARVEVVRPGRAGRTVTIGVAVRVVDSRSGKASTYRIVGPAEADPDRGRISYLSPIGQALLGQGPGSVVKARTPTGEMRLRIVGVGESRPRKHRTRPRSSQHRSRRR